MAGPVPLDLVLETPRLRLRRFQVSDAERVVEIVSNWSVARMLRLAPYPQTVEQQRLWLASHEAEWVAGEAYRFAITWGGVVIGCTDLDGVTRGVNSVGYWLDESAWGRGIATEAATALRDFAFGPLGLRALTSGHAFDNPASGHVLEKLGFRWTDDTTLFSQPRQTEIMQRRYRLERTAAAG